VRILTFPEAEVPPDLRLQAVAIQDQAWPGEGEPDPAPWHDPALSAVSMLLVEDGRVQSCLDMLSKELTHLAVTYQASGISAMVTAPDARRRGMGRKIAADAAELMRDSGADLAIFTCDSYLQDFYESAGYSHLPGTVLIGGTPEDPFPSDRFDKVTMARFFSPKAEAGKAGFVGARVELYPGDIDKLW
jgi:GNAT superfamily N-acetyltransferase